MCEAVTAGIGVNPVYSLAAMRPSLPFTLSGRIMAGRGGM